MRRRVLVTSLNLITPLGVDLKASWQGLVEGRSGIGKISLFDCSGHETRIAGEVPADFDDYARAHCSRRLANQMGRAIKMGYVCAKEAISGSGIDFDAYDRTRCAVIVGAADTGHSSIHDSKYWIMKTMPHGVSARVSQEYQLEGPNFTISAACASSAYAIAYGYDLISSNRADIVVAGGATGSGTFVSVAGPPDAAQPATASCNRTRPEASARLLRAPARAGTSHPLVPAVGF